MEYLTQEELKKLLHYDPETGLFVWLAAPAKNVKAGDIAGCITSRGYIHITISKKIYKAHRLAWLYMTGEWPKEQIDHKKHIKHDNRWSEIQEAAHQDNVKNRSLNKNNTSGVTGVFWHKIESKWAACVKVNSKRIHLGYYCDKFEAICARMSANNRYGFHANHGR